jgi:hypothetical protein
MRMSACNFEWGGYVESAANRRQKPVSPPGHRLYKSWILCRIAERIPESPDCGVDAVLEIHKGVIGPQPRAQLFACHNLTGALQQCQKNLQGLILQPDLDAIAAKFAGLAVDREYPKARGLTGTRR